MSTLLSQACRNSWRWWPNSFTTHPLKGCRMVNSQLSLAMCHCPEVFLDSGPKIPPHVLQIIMPWGWGGRSASWGRNLPRAVQRLRPSLAVSIPASHDPRVLMTVCEVNHWWIPSAAYLTQLHAKISQLLNTLDSNPSLGQSTLTRIHTLLLLPCHTFCLSNVGVLVKF